MPRLPLRFVPFAAGLCLSLAALGADVKIGLIELKGSPSEQAGAMPIFGKNQSTLRDVITTIDKSARRSDLSGLLIQLKDSELTPTQVEEIGSAIARLRSQGKKVHLFAEQYGPAELLLGSWCDEVIVQTGGGVSLPGLHMEEMFLANTLAWIGLRADMVQVGDYKGASEMMANSKPSPQWDQNINQLLDGMYGNIRARIKAGRNLDDRQLDAAMEVAWMAEPDQAKKIGLVDTVVDLAAITEHLGSAYKAEVAWTANLLDEGKEAAFELTGFPSILSMMGPPPDRSPTRPTIAVLHIQGTIIDGDSSGGGLFGGESVGSRTIRRAIEEIYDEDLIKGVVVRIDSPGGSAMASEVMWQGLRRLASKKPVWASVGSMAASGGYYCAVGADRIYVNPSSIVGSIGVVGGKISMGGLYEMAKINVVERSRGPRAALFSSTTPWSDADRRLVREKMNETYTLFTSRVSTGRPGIKLGETAEGRLFTGEKAVSLKMADKVGGFGDALADLAAELRLRDYDVLDYPAPKSISEVLEDTLKGFVQAPMPGDDRQARALFAMPAELLGPRAWPQVQRGLESIILLRDEPVLTTMPRVLIFR